MSDVITFIKTIKISTSWDVQTFSTVNETIKFIQLFFKMKIRFFKVMINTYCFCIDLLNTTTVRKRCKKCKGRFTLYKAFSLKDSIEQWSSWQGSKYVSISISNRSLRSDIDTEDTYKRDLSPRIPCTGTLSPS